MVASSVAYKNPVMMAGKGVAPSISAISIIGGAQGQSRPREVPDEAHHIYSYTLEVNEPLITVDIRLDFGESENIEVIDDDNVLKESDRFVVVGSVMPLTNQLICKVKVYDTDWKINCAVTMLRRSAPFEL